MNPFRCTGCMDCMEVCFYTAIEEDEFMRRKVAKVNPGVCQGCGACVAACMDGALDMKIFNDEQIYAEITGLFAVPKGTRRSGGGETAHE